jgi:hypothetical protein
LAKFACEGGAYTSGDVWYITQVDMESDISQLILNFSFILEVKEV